MEIKRASSIFSYGEDASALDQCEVHMVSNLFTKILLRVVQEIRKAQLEDWVNQRMSIAR